MWGTCSIDAFTDAYRAMLTAADEADYKEKVERLQGIVAEHAIGIPLCWDTAYYPYRTDRYAGWENFPGWGVINCDTWYNLYTIENQ